MKLGAWIKDRNMTLEAFGQLVGADKSSVSRWVDGTVPRHSTLRRIKEVTEGAVTADDFMTDAAEADGAGRTGGNDDPDLPAAPRAA